MVSILKTLLVLFVKVQFKGERVGVVSKERGDSCLREELDPGIINKESI